MLKGLSAVKWKRLTHAYGQAGDIPALIRALASPDPEKWVGAISGLYDTLCHQCCTVCEATGPAVPFLIELLGNRKVHCRGRILQLLGDITAASSYLDAHGVVDDPESRQELARELEWVRQSREGVWNGLDIFLELLTDLDKRIRIIVPFTLGRLVEFAIKEMPEGICNREPLRIVADRLAKHFEEEPSELVQASVIFALGRLLPHHAGAGRLLERQVKDRSASALLRFSAALNLAADAAGVTETVIEVLLEALKDPAATRSLFDSDEPTMERKHHPLAKAYREAGLPLDEESGTGFDEDDIDEDEDFTFPWLDDVTTNTIMGRLSRAKNDIRNRVMGLATPYLDKANPYTVESLVEPVLRLVFDGGKVTPDTSRKNLTPAQATALRHLYDNLKLWATDIGNVDSVFRQFGLTHNRNAWRKLLGIKDPPLTPARIKAMLARLVPDQQYSMDRPTVRRINLREIGTGAFLPHLKQYADLEDLDLSSLPITDADLVHLTGFKKLRKLQLPNTAVTDAGVETLAALENLEELNLNVTAITNAAFATLKNLPKLGSLMVWKTKVTAAALKKFEKAKPKCRVYR